MPTSYSQNVSPLLELALAENPRCVLDVGAGYGKWGFLLREYLDDFRWAHQIDGVEPWKDYTRRSHADHFYDYLATGTFPECADDLSPGYDLILMVDVLEHYEPAAAIAALRKALDMAPAVLIATPVGYPQGAVNGNELERHRSEWFAKDLAEIGRFENHSDPRSTIGLLRRP